MLARSVTRVVWSTSRGRSTILIRKRKGSALPPVSFRGGDTGHRHFFRRLRVRLGSLSAYGVSLHAPHTAVGAQVVEQLRAFLELFSQRAFDILAPVDHVVEARERRRRGFADELVVRESERAAERVRLLAPDAVQTRQRVAQRALVRDAKQTNDRHRNEGDEDDEEEEDEDEGLTLTLALTL